MKTSNDDVICRNIQECLAEAIPGTTITQQDALLCAYMEIWRRYHHFYHIWYMIEAAFATFRAELTLREWRMLLSMIIYHDVVFKLGREFGWNENESALWAERDMRAAGIDEAFIAGVMAGIRATATHTLNEVPTEFKHIIAMLLDLDLMGLGLIWKKFIKNTELLWQESLPHFTSEQYIAGRKKWAGTFLARPKIYHTEKMSFLETPARANLARLASL